VPFHDEYYPVFAIQILTTTYNCKCKSNVALLKNSAKYYLLHFIPVLNTRLGEITNRSEDFGKEKNP
jgi:hypothetical protein